LEDGVEYLVKFNSTCDSNNLNKTFSYSIVADGVNYDSGVVVDPNNLIDFNANDVIVGSTNAITGNWSVDIYEFESTQVASPLPQGIKDQIDIKLCNMIGGGRGGSFNPSEEVRQKQRVAKLGRKLSEEHRLKLSKAQEGKVHRSGYKLNLTPEQRELRAEIARNQVWTKERGQKISAAKIGFKHSEETKAKISATKTGVKQIDEHRKNTSIAVKKWWDQRKKSGSTL